MKRAEVKDAALIVAAGLFGMAAATCSEAQFWLYRKQAMLLKSAFATEPLAADLNRSERTH